MFETLPLWMNGAVFAAAAAAVWAAGTRIAGYADAIAETTGIGRGVLGFVLLAGITSLPEMAVATTAAVAGAPALSVNDLLGSAAINVLIIALADAVLGRDAITSVLAAPGVLLQGVVGIILLSMVVAATMTVDVPLFGASAWTWLILAVYAFAVVAIVKSGARRAWTAEPRPGRKSPREPAQAQQALRPLAVKTVVAAAFVLAGGFFLAKTGEAIAAQTGLGASFVGAVLLAASTSLPEVSTVIAAVRLRRYEMAVSDIFGTNLFNVIIIFAVDLVYAGPPVLAEVGRFAGFAALLAIILTALYVAGMIERRDSTFVRMGYDSIAAVVTYVAGIALLYQLR